MSVISSPETVFGRVATASPSAIGEAARLIREGRLIAFPTETVYGLGANALDDRAVAGIYAAKSRPRINPLIVHVSDAEAASRLVSFGGCAAALAAAFWPGALTLALPRAKDSPLGELVSAGLPTAAIRVPAQPVARALLEASGVPIAAPSANRSGRISPTTAAHVAEELNGSADIILDGGPCLLGLESTIIGFEGERPILLRKGAIERARIEAVAGPLHEQQEERLAAPGMMRSHYAPRARLRLNAKGAGKDEGLLAFGPAPSESGGAFRNLSASGDLREAAANLFRMLRELDALDLESIAVMPIPDVGLGEAINDRLARAAAPRDG